MKDSPNSTPSTKPHSAGRQRVIASCLTCRRRKVKCDHGHPTCGACMRGNHICTYATDQGLAASFAAPASSASASTSAPSRIAKSTPPVSNRIPRNTDVHARLDKLELLLEKAVAAKAIPVLPPQSFEQPKQEPESALTPPSNAGSSSSHGAGLSSDKDNGTLLLEEGSSQFVSSLHWALLADEIQDIKALLGQRPDEEAVGEDSTQLNSNSLVSLLALGRAQVGVPLASLLPKRPDHYDELLNIYFYTFDPMIRVLHKPTILRKFHLLVQEGAPLAFAIFYAAIYTLPPSVVMEKFGETRDELLRRYEQGVETSLAREKFLTSSSMEVLQGFVIWLTSITREDDMSKAWTLLGLATRIAVNQGLHRDPSTFPSGSFDIVTTELRRRLWHQIVYLEYRSAECKGQEPDISDDDFTTLFPGNLDDEDLIEGASPSNSAYDEPRYTSMTFPIVRFTAVRALRKIVQDTYRLEHRIVISGLHGTPGPEVVHELQGLYQKTQVMIDEMNAENHRKYLQHCNPEIPIQRLCLGLGSLMEWRARVLFWLRMPRAYRDSVFPVELRKLIFTKSIDVIEILNGANVDEGQARFHWHIGNHASFQAIMHVLSELRNKEFETPERARALQALAMVKYLRESYTSQAWIVVKAMIDKVHAENNFPPPVAQNSPQTFIQDPQMAMAQYPPNPTVTLSSPQPTAFASEDASVNYAALYVGQTTQFPMQQPQPMSFEQDAVPVPFTYADSMYNNIMGAGTTDANVDYEWGFWGDSVNLVPSTEYPMGFYQYPTGQ